MKYPLSIVVCTYNRSQLLKKCLDSLMNQTCKNYEVIVIDNNSSDNTKEVVEQYNSVLYFFEPKTGLSYARNTGYEKASGEYIAYMDDDAYAVPNWCEQIIDNINKFQFDVCGGIILPYFDSKPPFWFHEKLETLNYGKKGFVPKSRSTRGFAGSNIIFKREHLIKYKGFNTSLGMKGNNIGLGEESELCYRIAQEHDKFYYDPDMKMYHYTTNKCFSLSYRFQRHFTKGICVSRACNNKKLHFLKKGVSLSVCLLILPFTLLLGPIRNYYLVFLIQQILYRIGFFYSCIFKASKNFDRR